MYFSAKTSSTLGAVEIPPPNNPIAITVKTSDVSDLSRKLDFHSQSFINTVLSITYKKQIPPMRITTLKTNHKDLYFLLESKGKREG